MAELWARVVLPLSSPADATIGVATSSNGDETRPLSLSDREWEALKQRFGAFAGWQAERPPAAVATLGVERLERCLAQNFVAQVSTLVADSHVAAILQEDVARVEKLVLFQMYLLDIANNFVSFPNLYDAGRRALFEEGTLVMDGRRFNLAIRVSELAEHAKMAETSKIFVMYVEVMPGRKEAYVLAVPVTSGGRGNLHVGKHGVFMHVSGDQYDAVIVKLIENPISMVEAVTSPFKHLAKLLTGKLEAITQEKVFFVALPLKPLRGDGSPVRAFAMEADGAAPFPVAGANVDEGSNNAYWNGNQIVIWSYSSGWRSLAACPDVMAHEWAHAVTETTSGLVYEKESGALNEAFSDMIGAAFEFAHSGWDTPDWLMGENGRTTGQPFRDMANPHNYYDPDYYGTSDPYWVNVTNCTPSDGNDYCGVHTNSGVGNKWFYLLSDGGTHHSVTVTGIGVENATLVAYRSNALYWTSFSTYSEAAYGTLTAANDLDPSGVWAEQVLNAWTAVGVGMPTPRIAFAYPTGTPGLLTPGETATFETDLSVSYGGSVVPGSVRLHYSVNGGPEQIEPMTALGGDRYQGTLPAAVCNDRVTYYVSAEEPSAGLYYDPDPSTPRLAAPGTDAHVLFEDDFETDKGWFLYGQWGRGVPTGSGGQYGGPDPSSARSGSNVLGYNLAGDYPNDLPATYAFMPVVDCSGMSNIHLKFWRWLGVEQPIYDTAAIAVSNDGSSWTTVWVNPAEITDYSWVLMDVDISTVAAGQSTVFVHFTMGPTDGGWRYCGWNIDDLQVTGYTCVVAGDLDGDGFVDAADNCPGIYNPDQLDSDSDGFGDLCDICQGYDDAVDSDGDAAPDGCDACPGYDDALDADIDGVPDGCDLCAGFDDTVDSDGDRLPDGCDNCALVSNPGQEDTNSDGIGDACCCLGRVGDANGEGGDEPTIGDINALIAAIYTEQVPDPIAGCFLEADVNQSGGTTPVYPDDFTITDISLLIEYLYIKGPYDPVYNPAGAQLPDCP